MTGEPGSQIRTDLETLVALPEFRRFLFRHAIQNGGIFDQKGSGSHGRDLAHFEGRRDLALEMLAEVEQAMPGHSPEQLPILTTIQILREHVQSAPTEKKNDRYDRRRELGADDDPEE